MSFLFFKFFTTFWLYLSFPWDPTILYMQASWKSLVTKYVYIPLTLIYLTVWILFLFEWWWDTFNFLPSASFIFMSIIYLWFAYVWFGIKLRHSSFQWYMTCLDSQLFWPSAIKFIFSTLKILKIWWVN